jgi:hypothetical protein
MNQVRPEPTDTTNDVIDESFWHMALRLHEAREDAERRLELAEQRERALLIRLVVSQGASADKLQDCTLEELRRMAAATE